MRSLIRCWLFLVFLGPLLCSAQTAPVTTAPFLLVPGPDVTVPVTVTNFTDIGAISLTMDYNYSIAQVTGVTAHSSLPGFTADWTTIPGRLVMGWFGTSGVTLPDNAIMVEIHFTGLVDGYTDLVWWDGTGTDCEYAKYDGGLYTPLPDSPIGDYYHNGRITHHRDGAQTIAPVFPAMPGTICIPITVNRFINIGAISLTMDYDPEVLVFQSVYTTTIPTPYNTPAGNWIFTGQATTPGRLVVGGYGDGFSLPDESILYYACFTYNCGTTALTWWDDNETACEYADGTTLEPLYDEETSYYYQNGLVSGGLQADFHADNVTPPTYTEVGLWDDSSLCGDITSWSWSFDRSTVVFMEGTTSASQNPIVQFTDGGPYTVTLTITGPYFTDSETKTAYIWAGIPGLWTGDISTEWNAEVQNWDDHRIPTASIDVLIPDGRPRYPHWKTASPDGPDFVVGSHCKTITIQPASIMTVDGNVVVNP